MKKIPTVFVRNPEDRAHVIDEVNPGCEWVIAGEGTPTRKYDGTCTMFDGDRWWARREVKPGKKTPENFLEVEHDETTGKTVGWEPIEQSSFAKFHAEALEVRQSVAWLPGTYELVGPKINGNPERWGVHRLLMHAMAEEVDESRPRTFANLRESLIAMHKIDGCEGVVFHHPDGRMAKLKARDFG